MTNAECLNWIKALQEALCEVMNKAPFGSEDQTFLESWLVDVNRAWVEKNAPALGIV